MSPKLYNRHIPVGDVTQFLSYYLGNLREYFAADNAARNGAEMHVEY